jgi:hypothetical protein
MAQDRHADRLKNIPIVGLAARAVGRRSRFCGIITDVDNHEPGVRMRARLIGFCLLLVAQASCGGSAEVPCNSPVGEFASYGFQVESAQVTWALDTLPMHPAAVVAEQPSVGDCQLSIRNGRIPALTNSATCQRADGAAISLDCVVAAEAATPLLTRDPRARWLVQIVGLGDPRLWSVGLLAEAVPYPTGQVTPYLLESYPLYLGDSAGCRGTSEIPGGVAGLALTAEEAVGGVADSPTTVTPDYRRVLRMDLDRSVTLLTDGGATCGVPVMMTFSLRLVQTAADFDASSQPCYLCK